MEEDKGPGFLLQQLNDVDDLDASDGIPDAFKRVHGDNVHGVVSSVSDSVFTNCIHVLTGVRMGVRQWKAVNFIYTRRWEIDASGRSAPPVSSPGNGFT